MKAYYTILVPWVPREVATVWHPTESTGPFSTLSRGNFADEIEAIRWGQEKLNGCPYTIKRIDPETEL